MKTASTVILVVALACSVFVPVGAGRAAETPAAPQPLVLAQPGRTLVSDDFTQADKPNRRLTRGAWTVKNGLAVCAHDEELFKKYKNHGPAVWYDQEFTDGIVRFDFLPSADCKHFVFTINGRDGHVFRFVMNETGTDLRAWDANHQGKQLAKGGPALPKGQWTPVVIEIVGGKSCVHIGEKFHVVVEDPSYAVPKTVVGVSFHYGSVQLRNFQVTDAAAK